MRACMLAYSFYENDGRVKRYAETLAGRGDYVDVISLRHAGQAAEEMINGVYVYRIQERTINERGKLSYLLRLIKFLIKSTYFLSIHHLKKKYDLIHVHSVPDFEVFAALIPKLTGAKIILDIHDIVPEFYASKFGASKLSAVYNALILIEKASTRFSDHVIISNHIWHQVITSRSIRDEKCTTMLNYPDEKFYEYRGKELTNGKFVMLYPGTLNRHQGLDIAVKAFGRVAGQLPNAEFHIIGEGPTKGMLRRMIEERGLQNRILLRDSVSHDEIAGIMARANLGLVPKRANSFGNEAFSTKIFEFMALGIPVIVADTKIDKYYFNDSLVMFFKAGDDEDLAGCMFEMATDPAKRESLRRNAAEFIREKSWAVKGREYIDLVDRLTGNAKTAI